MVLRQNRMTNNFFLGCSGYPECTNSESIYTPQFIEHLLLHREYLNELIEKIISDVSISRGDELSIDNLVLYAREINEHIESEEKMIKGFQDKSPVSFW